ncbi:hypothetical protein OF83DRAFT_103379 [Amylostereum chailletii]|nr:hypothetical protein OF83DRAFT_103379 [Amylostereum chailletii]
MAVGTTRGLENILSDRPTLGVPATALTNLSVVLWALPPTQVAPFVIDPERHPRLHHLTLEGTALQLSVSFVDRMLYRPGVRHLALAVSGGEQCTVLEMRALLQKVSALTGSALVSVRFADKSFAGDLRGIERREAGKQLRDAVALLDKCAFVIEDWEGRRVLDVSGGSKASDLGMAVQVMRMELSDMASWKPLQCSKKECF